MNHPRLLSDQAPQSSVGSTTLRFITAASLFDGHDASINIMRRILQDQGVEVIHLGHDRSVQDIVNAAIQEDAHGIAVSSYQGGHMEFFTYMVDLLAEAGRSEIKVFGGGGGTITDKEIQHLHAHGVAHLYSVEDGRAMGLVGMIQHMIQLAQNAMENRYFTPLNSLEFPLSTHAQTARMLSKVEHAYAHNEQDYLQDFRNILQHNAAQAPIIGITGVGGAGKSSLTDELLRRFLLNFPNIKVGILSVDPTRRRSGGALLGDRIRMNAIQPDFVFMRSMATRSQHASVSPAVKDALLVLDNSYYDVLILETAGIGQSGSEVIDLCDVSLYVMTPEFGAPSQLEKIDMLDFADVVALNKSDKRGAEDAQRYVAKQMQRNRQAFDQRIEHMPVFNCIASRFGDQGVDQLFAKLCEHLQEIPAKRTRNNQKIPNHNFNWTLPEATDVFPSMPTVVPANRIRYLSEISNCIRSYHQSSEQQAQLASELDGVQRSLKLLGVDLPGIATAYPHKTSKYQDESVIKTTSKYTQVQHTLIELYNEKLQHLSPSNRNLLRECPGLVEDYSKAEHSYTVRGRQILVQNYTQSLSGLPITKVALPQTKDWSTLLLWRRKENIPGSFPYTAGVFPYKRSGEDPTRMFAGEGHAERSNHRFHYLSMGQSAARLSTAFDSVTLYGRDPDLRPDIYGKVGNSGVSVATLDDAKRLYSGFDLCASSTSVSMTINGPAPMILAFFLNTAIDQQVEKRLKESGRWEDSLIRMQAMRPQQPHYRADLPKGHDGSGLGLLGFSGEQLVSAEEYTEIKAYTLASVRGTVQADILKEDQAQNTCIFSTDFALKMMGDIQSYFIDHRIRNFYSVSISGYHIAEAGANPITQLAFTLANGFTFVEYYRARGMDASDFARNLSFFFSNGVDPEYAVIGRVARRIWAIALRDLYGADKRSQQLKYHIQTSGRSLHAQEIQFNDIRTTLQALYAIMDNCNSLHTNAYDEAITTPTEESVRRALAIQMIINHELGLSKNENPLQGSYFIEALTDLVEEAVLQEFDRITDRGGVLGAMEVMYQRAKIQEESMIYEHQKHSGELPIIGVNTFLPKTQAEGVIEVDLIRATEEEKQAQLDDLAVFHTYHQKSAQRALSKLQQVALAGDNVFAELMETVKVCSLGQMTEALFAVGGQYRRNV
jgi:isobutyryl-CoA mutase